MRKVRLARPAPTPAILLLLLLSGCAGDTDRDGNARTYEVRGQVVQILGSSSLNLTHEAVDDWVDREGKVTGMDAMNMTFLVAEGVELAGIQVGDVVEFTLRVDWEADRPVEITRVRELPPGTRLQFRAAEPKAEQGGH